MGESGGRVLNQLFVWRTTVSNSTHSVCAIESLYVYTVMFVGWERIIILLPSRECLVHHVHRITVLCVVWSVLSELLKTSKTKRFGNILFFKIFFWCHKIFRQLYKQEWNALASSGYDESYQRSKISWYSIENFKLPEWRQAYLERVLKWIHVNGHQAFLCKFFRE